MKKKSLLLLICFLFSCSSNTTSVFGSFSNSIITTLENVTTSVITTSTSSSNGNSKNTINKTTSSSIVVSNDESSINRPQGSNPDGGGLRMPIPENKNNKISIGNDNSSMSEFSFINGMPQYFRAIHGNQFSKGSYYANGEFKISITTPAKQGFQTGMFITNLKLEIRILIGQMNNSNDGNKIDKDIPVLSIYGFAENGDFVRAKYIDEITKNDENSYVKTYMDGTDIAYLEVRAMQLPYKGSQSYNMGLRGLQMIAWPYPL